jgi:hypothetical protein
VSRGASLAFCRAMHLRVVEPVAAVKPAVVGPVGSLKRTVVNYKMRVLSVPLGRLGNAVFRYLATIIYHIVFDATIVHPQITDADKYLMVTDEQFIYWMNAHLNGNILGLDEDTTYGFFGYFQHDTIYLKYRKQIIEYIRTHPKDVLTTDGNYKMRTDFKYFPADYFSDSLLNAPQGFKKYYETVVHLRLEDFIENGAVIHPLYIKQLLESVGASSYCLVMNSPDTDLELSYLDYLRKYFNVIIESNDIITDYHIMKNAKTLVCSTSTISWAAAFFSDTVQRVYMPNYPAKRPHETFRKPIENTLAYEYKTCSKRELEEFLRTAV